MDAFIQKHARDVIGVLSGFDRVVFRGTMRRLVSVDGVLLYLNVMHVLLKDFGRHVQMLSTQLKKAVTAVVEAAGRPVRYMPSSATGKEQLARSIAERDRITSGIIALLTCVETCQTFSVHPNARSKRLELRPELRKCLFLYLYQIHPELGFMHARIQTWIPFTIQICINGREWLSRQMDAAGIDYVRRENCFLSLSDVEAAQRLLDAQLRVNWPRLLDGIASQINPVHRSMLEDFRAPYYWAGAETEWATDVMFRDSASLARIYPRLLRYAMATFGSPEVMRFLGHRVPATGRVNGHFQGEIVTDLKHRPEGVRIKHRIDGNFVKLYDKQGSVLRMETTINRTRDFKVYRPAEGDPKGTRRWRILRKGVSDFRRRAQISQSCNQRYLQALASADDTAPVGDILTPLTRPARLNGSRVRAMRPSSSDDLELLRACGHAEFTLNGFRNRDLRKLLYPESAQGDSKVSARITRKIRLLRAHRLVRKVPRTSRYMLTARGRQALAAIIAVHEASTAKLLDLAA